MNQAGLSQLDLLDIIAKKVNMMQADMGALLQAQQISNYLSLANNMQVPENIRNQVLNRALEMMGLSQSKAAEQFIGDSLPTDLIR